MTSAVSPPASVSETLLQTTFDKLFKVNTEIQKRYTDFENSKPKFDARGQPIPGVGNYMDIADLEHIRLWVQTLEKIWLRIPHQLPTTLKLEYFYAMFGFEGFEEAENIAVQNLLERSKFCCTIVTQLQTMIKALVNKYSREGSMDDLTHLSNNTLALVLYSIFTAKEQLMLTVEQANFCASQTIMEVTPNPLTALTFMGDELFQEMQPVNKLILFVLKNLKEHRYKKFRNSCFRQRYTDSLGGLTYPTHSWIEVCTIQEFIYKVCNKETHAREWMWLTSRSGMVQQVAQYLTESTDACFPELNFNRYLFAFRNGLFLFESGAEYFDHNDVPVDVIGPNEAAVNYFDTDFNNGHPLPLSPDDFCTPTLDSIFRFQFEHAFDKDEDVVAVLESDDDDKERKAQELIDGKVNLVIQWAYVFFGRMFFDLGHVDKWQVVPLFLGVAGTGKSTLGKLLEYIFPNELIGIMSSNIEAQFGLQGLYDKLAWVCYELKNNFQLPLSELQSIISGEHVRVAIKNKEAKTVKWSAPGMMFGNEVPKWADRGGALLRRFVIWRFDRKIPDDQVIPNLPDLLHQELGVIIPKVVIMYRFMVHSMKGKDVWFSLPRYFRDTRNKFLTEIDNLAMFIAEEKRLRKNLQFADENFMPEEEFIELFKQFLQPLNIKMTWNTATYETSFQSNALYIEHGMRNYRKDADGDLEPVMGKWIQGVTSVANPNRV